MKKILFILLVLISFQGFSQVVKLTDGDPAWVPNYLIISGNLYFLDGTTYTSLGDSLGNYIYKADSSLLYYTPRQIDSVLNSKTFSQWNDITGGIEYTGGKTVVTDTTYSQAQVISPNATIESGSYRKRVTVNGIYHEVYNGTSWKLVMVNKLEE